MPTRAPRQAAGFAVLLLLALPAWTGAQSASEEPRPLTLEQAVSLTFDRSVELDRSRERVALRRGAARELTGTFDTRLRVTSSVEHEESVLMPDTRNSEQNIRRALSEVIKGFDEVRDSLARSIEEERGELPICPAGLDTNIDIPGLATDAPLLCVPAAAEPDDPDAAVPDANAVQELLRRLFGSTAGGGSGDVLHFLSLLSDILGNEAADLDELFAEDLTQLGLEIVQLSYRIAVNVQERAALALERRGVFPENEYRRKFSFRTELQKPLRSGATVTLEGSLEGTESNYRGKPLDPSFGGRGIQNTFRASASVGASKALLRGRGAVAAAAPERAAARNLVATEQQHQHTAASQALATTLAYLDLAASRDTVALLEHSLATQRELRDGTRTLAEAGEIPRSDINRAEARVASIEASVAEARVAVISAQTALAETIGLREDEVGGGLVPSDQLTQGPAEGVEAPEPSWIPADRHDLQSAVSLREASRLLFDAARVNTRNRLDISMNLGMASDYFGPFFRVLPDEFRADRFEPHESAVDYFSPRAFWRTLRDTYRPFFAVQVSFELPFGNNVARGRLMQAQASLSRSSVVATNLQRLIGQRVMQQGATLERATGELDQRREALAQHEKAWDGTQTLRLAGELTLIDTLLTEQRLTSARLASVRARRGYAAALARLRFETGKLVAYREGRPLDADLSGLVDSPGGANEETEG